MSKSERTFEEKEKIEKLKGYRQHFTHFSYRILIKKKDIF